MEYKYSVVGPQTTMADITQLAAYHLLNNGLDGFDFDVPGESEDGTKIVLHLECKVEIVG